MKTELALLMSNDCQPLMNLKDLAKLFNVTPRTAENWIYAEKMPVPVFKAGGAWMAHVSDVAKYIDEQRALAVAELERRAA